MIRKSGSYASERLNHKPTLARDPTEEHITTKDLLSFIIVY